MDKILIVKTPGLFINIPGIPSFRTPARINVTKLDENIVIAELKKHGVKDFKINDEKTLKEKIVKKINDIIKPGFNNEELLQRMREHQSSIENIELLLKKFMESRTIGKTEEEKVEFKKPDFDDSVEDFIPSINLKNIKSKIK